MRIWYCEGDMPTGPIVKVWQDGNTINAAVRITESGGIGNVEYIASVPVGENLGFLDATFEGKTFVDLTNPEKKEALRLAVKVIRDKQRALQADVAGITGNVTI